MLHLASNLDVLGAVISSHSAGESKIGNRVVEGGENSESTVVVSGAEANNEMGFTVNEAVLNDLPTNKAWMEKALKMNMGDTAKQTYHVVHRGAIES